MDVRGRFVGHSRDGALTAYVKPLLHNDLRSIFEDVSERSPFVMASIGNQVAGRVCTPPAIATTLIGGCRMAVIRTRRPRAAVKRRNELREEFWPDQRAWEGPEEIGYFCGPRTLPLILLALADKNVSGNQNPGLAYLELLARHMGQGVIEMTHEEDHAFSAGYSSGRAVRTWRDRMSVLEESGFIRTSGPGPRRYARVFLVHPSIAMKKLRDRGKIVDELWEAYRARQIEAQEPSGEDLLAADDGDQA